MRTKVTLVIRILLALFMLLFGINKFAGFMEFPAIPGDGGTLMTIYFTSGFLSIIGALEIVTGLLLLVGKFIPISITVIVAIMFNATVFHLLHDPANVMGALIGLILGVALVFSYREKFRDFLNA